MNPFQTKDSNATQDAKKKQARLKVQNLFGDAWGQGSLSQVRLGDPPSFKRTCDLGAKVQQLSGPRGNSSGLG